MWGYLQDAGDEADGLTVRKFQDRGGLLESTDHAGKIVFTVKRHRAICGDQYIPGVPMAAYETFWPRYVYDPFAKTLEIDGEVRPSVSRVDVVELVERQSTGEFLIFSVEQEDEGYVCSESTCSESRVVSSPDEAARFALDVLSGLDFSVDEEQIADSFESDDEADDAIKRYRGAWREKMIQLAHEAWDYKDSF